MDMNDTNCVLCNNPHNSNKFNLQEHTTLQSFTVLQHYVEYVVGEQFILNNNHNICVICFSLINEIEKVEIRARELKKELTELYSNYKKKCETQLLTVVPDFPLQDISDNLLQDRSNDNTKVVQESQTAKCKSSFECTLCQKKYALKSRLEAHIKNSHRNIDENRELVHIQKFEQEFSDLNDSIKVPDREQDEMKIRIEKSEEKVGGKQEQKSKNQKSKGRKRSLYEPKLYECPECDKKWKSQSELKTHILSHSNERPFICEICGQAYKHKTALDVHVGMHNGINPFTCVYCKKAFTQKGGLMRHIAIHTGERHHQCHLCGKRFVHHTSYNIHRLSHTGEKAYKCGVCGLALMSGSHLKRHMRVHTGEKKFACRICGKRFAEKYNLAAHEKLHDRSGAVQKRKYRCETCPNSYDHIEKLEEHIANQHQNHLPSQQVENTVHQSISNAQVNFVNEYNKNFTVDTNPKNELMSSQNNIHELNLDMHNQYLRSLHIYTDNNM